MLPTLDDELRHECKITAITIASNSHTFWNGTPMEEWIYFHRSDRTHSYRILANRESFFRCVRAMRRLAVRKWMDKGG